MAETPLQIAFYTDVFPRISNTFVLNQIVGLLDRGHDVHVYARSPGDGRHTHEHVQNYGLDARMRHIPIPHGRASRLVEAARRLSRPATWRRATLQAFDVRRFGHDATSLVQLYSTLSFLDHPSYDIVHAQFGTLGPSLLPLVRTGVLRAPLVVSFRGADVTSALVRRPGLYDELVREADLFLPVSHAFRKRLEALGAPAERIEVLHSGIDLNAFPFRPRSRAPQEPTRLLFVGRLTEKKGLRFAIDALQRARAAGRRIELTVVGEGPLEASLRAHASRAAVDQAVHWAGRCSGSEVAAHLAQSHLLVAPSITASNGDQEGIPNTVKEAMACGLPVLTTVHSGIPELVEDGLSGFTVPERDADALAARLLELVDHPDRWPAMGAAGREKIAREFHSEALNDRLVGLYRRAVQTKAAGRRA